MAETPQSPAQPSNNDLKAAFKAFKKRLKLTQLNEESKMTRSPLTGHSATVFAITPPSQFSQAVWDELVKQNKIKKAGQGLYELVDV